MFDFIGTAVLVALTISIALKGNKSPFIRLNDVRALFCYAALSALAARQCASWTDIYRPLFVVALPILTQYSAGFYPFQLANLFGIYKSANGNDFGFGHNIITVGIHSYLLLASLDKKDFAIFADIKDILLYTDERRLSKIQKFRDIVLGDIKKLPERMLLKNSVNELTYDVNKPLFIIRAITRVMWRPMLPLYILSVITGMVSVASSLAESRILHSIEFPLEHRWFSGYAYVILEFVLIIGANQVDRVESFMKEEVGRVVSSVKLHLFRLPLSNKGLQKNHIINHALYAVDCMPYTLTEVQSIISGVVRGILAFVPLYIHVGWLSLIPLCVAILYYSLDKGHAMLFGPSHLWTSYSWYEYDGKVDEVFHNIKSIKMFGWEKVYTDPMIQEYWKKYDEEYKFPWYTPIARISNAFIRVIYTATEQIASFMVFYLHFKNKAGSLQPISTVDMLWMNNLIKKIHLSVKNSISRLGSLSEFIDCNYSVEKALKGSYIYTLPHYPVDNTNTHGTEPKAHVDYSKPSVSIGNGAFSWNNKETVLNDVSFSVEQGELVAVVGKTGSGRTSLLLSICGEVEMSAGTGAVVGSMALVEQTPWIMNGTLRENILFGRDYDEEYYNKVVFACALVEDINNWAKKDLTVIGERGINISGGQKARLALARAVYSRADIYILDDPLSAVDAHVKRHILDNVIMDSGLLAGKIRIVSTNMQGLLPYFDKVLSLGDNKSASISQNTRQDYQPLTETADTTLDCDSVHGEKSNDSSGTAQTPDSLDDKLEGMDEGCDDPSEITEKSWSNWDNAMFVFKMCGMPALAIILVSALLRPLTEFIFDGFKLDELRNDQDASHMTSNVVYRIIFMEMLQRGCITIIVIIGVNVKNYISNKHLTSRIKSMFVKGLIHAPLSFFDSTTRQEISSAYNNGTEAMSTEIPDFLGQKITEVVTAILSLYRVATNAPHLLIFVPMFIWASKNRESIEIPIRSSLEKIETQVLIDQEKVDNTIADGKRLIRIFNVESHFTAKYMDKKDKQYRAKLPERLMDSYLTMFYRVLYRVVISLCKFTALVQNQVFQHKMLPVELGMYTDLAYILADSVSDIIGFKAGAMEFKNKIETFRRFIDMDGEKMFVKNATKPEEHWPSTGRIEFRNFSMKYREDLEHVLKDVNLTINPGEKIGIVGRTGAGKTSLTRALFRLIDSKTCSGSIVVDGQDIFSLNIGDLRPKLGIIPQEPTMFEGTFRQNLDPLVKHNIENMWSAIIKCEIVEKVQPKDPRGYYYEEYVDEETVECIKDWNDDWEMSSWCMRIFLYLFIEKPTIHKAITRRVRWLGLNRHAGNSFSDGQQQIFGLCRLLMRNRKIVVLDEATANVDLETDQRMQKLIRSEFNNCTVLTIAHRLETIMNSDRIIVMDSGRIAEIGSPSELLEKNGHFAELVKANDFEK